AFDRIDYRGKLKQHTISHGLHEATPVFCHERVGNLAVFAECPSGADLVETHEPRVACDISRDYGRQPASDPAWLRFGHGHASRSRQALYTTEASMNPPREPLTYRSRRARLR